MLIAVTIVLVAIGLHIAMRTLRLFVLTPGLVRKPYTFCIVKVGGNGMPTIAVITAGSKLTLSMRRESAGIWRRYSIQKQTSSSPTKYI